MFYEHSVWLACPLELIYKHLWMTNPEKNDVFYQSSVYMEQVHCVKSVRIRSYSGPYSVRMRETADQNNSEYRHFSGSGTHQENTCPMSYMS